MNTLRPPSRRRFPLGAADVLDGLIHRWRFDEGTGTTGTDEIGAKNATLAGIGTNDIISVTGTNAAAEVERLMGLKAISELVSQNKLKEAVAAMLAREEVTVKARSAPGATAKEKSK